MKTFSKCHSKHSRERINREYMKAIDKEINELRKKLSTQTLREEERLNFEARLNDLESRKSMSKRSQRNRYTNTNEITYDPVDIIFAQGYSMVVEKIQEKAISYARTIKEKTISFIDSSRNTFSSFKQDKIPKRVTRTSSIDDVITSTDDEPLIFKLRMQVANEKRKQTMANRFMKSVGVTVGLGIMFYTGMMSAEAVDKRGQKERAAIENAMVLETGSKNTKVSQEFAERLEKETKTLEKRLEKLSNPEYKIKSGDYLIKIAKDYNVSYDSSEFKEVVKMNKITNPDIIKTGDTLKLTPILQSREMVRERQELSAKIDSNYRAAENARYLSYKLENIDQPKSYSGYAKKAKEIINDAVNYAKS